MHVIGKHLRCVLDWMVKVFIVQKGYKMCDKCVKTCRFVREAVVLWSSEYDVHGKTCRVLKLRRLVLFLPWWAVLLWFRWLVAGLIPQSAWLDPTSVHVSFMVDRVILWQVFLWVPQFSPCQYHSTVGVIFANLFFLILIIRWGCPRYWMQRSQRSRS